MNNQSVNQRQVSQEAIETGRRLASTIGSDGWKDILNYYEEQQKAFLEALLYRKEKIEDFENLRQQLVGIKTLIEYAGDCVETARSSIK